MKESCEEDDEFTIDKLLFPSSYELCIPHLFRGSEKENSH